MVHQEQFSFETTGHRHMADVTDQVTAIVGCSGVKTGVVQVFCVGSTAAVGTIEFEPGLERDLPEILDRLIPPSRDYGHELAWHDGNGHSHLQATLMGPSLSVPVGRYHLIVSSMALHHIAGTEEVLGAFYQMLHPQGLLCIADLDTEPGVFHAQDVAASVHHHGFDRAELKRRLAGIGFCDARDVTAHTLRKPVESGGERDFPVFLIVARKQNP